MKISRRQLLLILGAAAALIVADFCIEVLAPDLAEWLKSHFGEYGYQNRLWILLVIAVLIGLVVGGWQDWSKKSSSPDSSISQTLKSKLYAKFKLKYQQRIKDKLAMRIPVNLSIIPFRIDNSDEPANNIISLRHDEVSGKITEMFDRANGRLLVVGQAGAGKTTLLLQLALEIYERPGEEIPILLNLISWRTDFGSIDEWLRNILSRDHEIGASKTFAEEILNSSRLILLLDGLDELPSPDQISCLSALGEYGKISQRRFVISCRRDMIPSLRGRIPTNIYGSIELLPLTASQVENHLTSLAFIEPEAKPLLEACQKDTLLKKALENPFYLNTAQLLFSPGKNWSDFGFVANDVIGRQQELVQKFVAYVLAHKIKRYYSVKKTERWLRFLANQMEKRKLKIFELTDIRPKMSRNELFAFHVFGLSTTISLAVIISVLLFFIGAITNNLTSEYYLFMSWMCLILLVRGIRIGIKASMREDVGLPVYYKSRKDLVMITGPYQHFYSNFSDFIVFFVPHITMRILLTLEGSLPIDLVRFLNEMSRRHLLEFDGDLNTETGGGVWRWRHRIIQEYFLKEK
ncbi:MAG: NACHT domain-containing protein [Haliscomenobacteraceae bacterium CHB4]|nr:NACHT domain-containing protein [Haliscomenobacteraceae bacterium CHB4]